MREFSRWIALFVILVTASVAWLTLGSVMLVRTESTETDLRGAVSGLWGEALVQPAPDLVFEWQTSERRTELTGPADAQVSREVIERVSHQRALQPDATAIEVAVDDDVRRKGLMWFPMYDLDFSGTWSVTHPGPESGVLHVRWRFPSADGYYDDFRLAIDGVEVQSGEGWGQVLDVPIPVTEGQTVQIAATYKSRGQESFVYRPGEGVVPLRDFSLTVKTDFSDIDYPGSAMSPSERRAENGGWALDWKFERLVTGRTMGVVVPSPIQPGPLAAEMSFSAPISLALFILWLYVLDLLGRVNLHPMHYAFLAAAFFSFHLLFGYSVDHLPVEAAFGASAAVSVGLVVSYLRIVTGARFALREAGVAQLVYLVGFSAAHFWDGYTGLTLTSIGIVTLFAVMQLTARVDWSQILSSAPSRAPSPR